MYRGNTDDKSTPWHIVLVTSDCEGWEDEEEKPQDVVCGCMLLLGGAFLVLMCGLLASYGLYTLCKCVSTGQSPF